MYVGEREVASSPVQSVGAFPIGRKRRAVASTRAQDRQWYWEICYMARGEW